MTESKTPAWSVKAGHSFSVLSSSGIAGYHSKWPNRQEGGQAGWPREIQGLQPVKRLWDHPLSLNDIEVLLCSKENFLELAKVPSALPWGFEAPSQFSRCPGEQPLSLLQGITTWLSSPHLGAALSLGLGYWTLPGPKRLPDVFSN